MLSILCQSLSNYSILSSQITFVKEKMYRLLTLLIVLAATVSAATIDIDVGEDGSLKFNPASTTAAVGDV